MLVDTETPTPNRSDTIGIINWELCILCQENVTGLQCPYADNKVIIGSGYKSIAEQLTSFNELGHMPISVDIKQLDDGGGIEATLMRHHAGWLKKIGTPSCTTAVTHVQVIALLILKMTSASSVMSPVDLKVSTMLLYNIMTLMQMFVDVQLS